MKLTSHWLDAVRPLHDNFLPIAGTHHSTKDLVQ